MIYGRTGNKSVELLLLTRVVRMVPLADQLLVAE